MLAEEVEEFHPELDKDFADVKADNELVEEEV